MEVDASWYLVATDDRMIPSERAACDVEARRFDRCRGRRQSHCLCIAAAGGSGHHRKGGEWRGPGKQIVNEVHDLSWQSRPAAVVVGRDLRLPIYFGRHTIALMSSTMARARSSARITWLGTNNRNAG